MGLNTRLIDRAAQELSKTPLIALIGALQEKIRPSKCMSLYRCTGKICKIDGGGRMQIHSQLGGVWPRLHTKVILISTLLLNGKIT